MEKITSNSQIERATTKVLCGDEQGTGFYINESVLLTAWHVVSELDDGETAIIDGNDYDMSAILIKDTGSDVCLLKVKSSGNILPLSPLTIAYNQECVSYGYPYSGDADGDTFQGKVNKVKLDHHWDFSFASSKIQDQVYTYEGLSGAPVISNGYVVGFVRIQSNESVCAVSVATIHELLNSSGIDIVPLVTSDSIPEQLSENVVSSTPNYQAHDALIEILENGRGWFYCFGSPGSGKTTFSAWFEPSNDDIKICGRYFTKIPYDDIPLSTRVSRSNLIEWFERSIRENGIPVDIIDSLEKRIERLPMLLELLNHRLNNTHGVFIIDGIDEVPDLEGFLGVLPLEIPSNISIVLSGTSYDVLPARIKTQINEVNSLEIEPLEIGQCEAFIRKELTDENIETEFVQNLAVKSEGHPLYLRYLINYVNNESFPDLVDSNWLDEIPAIQGDISVYYNSIWDKFFREEGKLWIVLTLSQIRGTLEQNELIAMLPETHRLGFISNFAPISYLLKTEGVIELYHTSFKHYISENCSALLTEANNYIYEYCSSNEESYYSICNKLFHLTRSTRASESIIECNQNWADNCALNHVAPDLVLADLKSVIELTADEKIPHEIIRLLLLLQRLEFRYDSVFADNAVHIASTLISRGDIEGAMKYLIRENTLLVGDEDGLYFLQLLYEKDCIEEADKLLEIFKRNFRRYIQDEFNGPKEDGLSLAPILVNIKASALSFNSKGREAFLDCMNSLDNLKDLASVARRAGDESAESTFQSVRSDGTSWMSAYMYRKANHFVPSEEIATQFEIQIDSTWCAPKAMSLVQYKDLTTFSGAKIDKFEKFDEALAEIETLAITYGYDKDIQSLRTILLALFDDCSNVELVSQVASDYLAENDLPTLIRERNGVDFDVQNAFNLFFESKCRGYIYEGETLPSLPDKRTRNSSWEGFLSDVLSQVGLVEGILVKERYQSGQLLELSKNRIVELLEILDFELNDRARWERSYLIPESLLPFIYARLTELLSRQCPEKIDSLINHLLNSGRNQLGLFNEGYRDVFYNVIETLFLELNADVRIVELVNNISDFVQINVQNRWERTPELLRISEYYSLLEKFEEADAIFEIMLQSSMGPSWYKEAQFELLNSTFKLNCSEADLKKHAHNFASILQEASGEMTFQRYVRNDKERFVGNLASRGLYKEARDYLIFELMPPPKVLNFNAEHIEVDSLFLGMGYSPGGNNLSVESAVLRLLEACNNSKSNLRAAIAVSFILNSDVFRYANDYGGVIISALNSLSLPEERQPIYNELAAALRDSSFDESRNDLIKYLRIDLKEEYYLEFKEVCSQNQIELPNIEEQVATEPSEEREPDKFSEFNDEYEKVPRNLSRLELIEQGVESFQDRISVWFPNWSSESRYARNYLKELFETPEEIVNFLKPSISKIDMDVWVAIDRLLWFFDGVISEEEADRIYSHVSAHFDLLVHTTDESKDKYQWLINENQPTDSDSTLIDLMITLQTHPTSWVRAAAKNSLLLITESEMETLVTSYVNSALSGGMEGTLKICRQELCSYALEEPEELTRVLNIKFPNLKDMVVEQGSLDKFFSFYKMSKALSDKGFSQLYAELHDCLPDSIPRKNEVIFEEEELESVQWKIDFLNENQLLDEQFCEEVKDCMRKHLDGLTIKDVQKSDIYLNRSYPETPLVDGREEAFANDSLSKAIFRSMSKENIEELASVIIDD